MENSASELVQLNIRVPKDVKEALMKVALERGETISRAGEHAICSFVDSTSDKQKAGSSACLVQPDAPSTPAEGRRRAFIRRLVHPSRRALRRATSPCMG